MRGTPRRPWYWVDDLPRRARLEASARDALPTLTYRRRQSRHGPVHIWEATVDVPGYEPRTVTIECAAERAYTPRVFADGASVLASPHRYPERGYRRLCIWYAEDDDDRRWVPEDGLLALFRHGGRPPVQGGVLARDRRVARRRSPAW